MQTDLSTPVSSLPELSLITIVCVKGIWTAKAGRGTRREVLATGDSLGQVLVRLTESMK